MRRFFGFRASRPLTPLAPPAANGRDFDSPPMCPHCRASLQGLPSFTRYRVCDECGHHLRLDPRQRIALLVDGGSFLETDPRLGSTDPLSFQDDVPYRERLLQQQARTAQADAVITGSAKLRGHSVVIAVLDFDFMGGSMGVVVGEKIARACGLARKERWPLLTVVASGGARMQEGILALMQMAKTASAIKQLREAGVLTISILTNPTTGGVFASFASLADIVVAEPRALIGFAGPRVVEQTIGAKLPPGSHTAEFLFAHGILDDIVERPRLRSYVGTLLEIVSAVPTQPKPDPTPASPSLTVQLDAWEIVQRARLADRPTALDYVSRIVDSFVELHGDRMSGDDPATFGGLGMIGGRPIALVGLERGHHDDAVRRNMGRPYPEGFRKAQRIMRLAARLRLPLVTLIDTPGAYPGIESEERGLAREIAETLALMSDLPTPTVAAIIGEGGSGGALALAVADRVLMQEQAIYSVIAPEGAAAILYRDAVRAPEIARKLRLTAADLTQLGVTDTIVAEPVDGAAADPEKAARTLQAAILQELTALQGRSIDRLVRARLARYEAIGRAYTRVLDPSAVEATKDVPSEAVPQPPDKPNAGAGGDRSAA